MPSSVTVAVDDGPPSRPKIPPKIIRQDEKTIISAVSDSSTSIAAKKPRVDKSGENKLLMNPCIFIERLSWYALKVATKSNAADPWSSKADPNWEPEKFDKKRGSTSKSRLLTEDVLREVKATLPSSNPNFGEWRCFNADCCRNFQSLITKNYNARVLSSQLIVLRS